VDAALPLAGLGAAVDGDTVGKLVRPGAILRLHRHFSHQLQGLIQRAVAHAHLHREVKRKRAGRPGVAFGHRAHEADSIPPFVSAKRP
jgi:hypothetical protein